MKLSFAATLIPTVAASSYNVADQAAAFAKLEGYWAGTGQFRYVKTVDDLSSPEDTFVFINITFDGDRYYEHRYMTYPVNQYASHGDTYAITSSEDADLHLVGENWGEYPADHTSFRTIAVDDDTVLMKSQGDHIQVSTFVFLDDDMMRGTTEIQILEKDHEEDTPDEKMELIQLFSSAVTYMRVATAEEWMSLIEKNNLEHTIPPIFHVDLPSECLDEDHCVSGDDWAKFDPKIGNGSLPSPENMGNDLRIPSQQFSIWIFVCITLAALVFILGIALFVCVQKVQNSVYDTVKDKLYE